MFANFDDYLLPSSSITDDVNDLQGTSCTMGGFARGKGHGVVPNMADFNTQPADLVPVHNEGRVLVYKNEDHTNIKAHAVRVPLAYTLGPVLKAMLLVSYEVYKALHVYKGKALSYDVWCCPAWGWIMKLVQDPLLAPHFEWDAKWLFKLRVSRSRTDHPIGVQLVFSWVSSRPWTLQIHTSLNGVQQGVKWWCPSGAQVVAKWYSTEVQLKFK
ncbi:hypothetical protein BDN71DRAFT_1435786 [Pleurotus eryngii]|uniref:Uncharacterized protein n=1 Tax=Pleurotus eryngii TaxID=5323 RepID=A0A9P5ZKG4_PLEER|nr:hypothetical protein BDN71DRAFT_1435786 [Pleurotus eryngii]